MPGALWLTLENLMSVDGGSFRGGQKVYLLFNCNIMKYLLKTTGGETEGLIFVVWSTLIKDGGLDQKVLFRAS